MLFHLQGSSRNYVFESDVVPRLPGHVDYWKHALTTLAAATVTQLVCDAFKGVDLRYFYKNFEEEKQKHLPDKSPVRGEDTACAFTGFGAMVFRQFWGNEGPNALGPMVEKLKEKIVTRDIE